MLASYSINVRKRLTDRGRVRPPYMVRIGIAMLQGARHEHCEAIQNAAMEMNVEIEVVELRKRSQVDSSIHGLILPGGESTTMRIASQSESLLDGISIGLQIIQIGRYLALVQEQFFLLILAIIDHHLSI